jgi:hypothetical protein
MEKPLTFNRGWTVALRIKGDQGMRVAGSTLFSSDLFSFNIGRGRKGSWAIVNFWLSPPPPKDDFWARGHRIQLENKAVAEGGWHHVAVIHDPYNREVKVVVNGKQDKKRTDYIRKGVVTTDSGEEHFRIYMPVSTLSQICFGGTKKGTMGRWKGWIDDLYIWDWPLDEQTLQEILKSK